MLLIRQLNVLIVLSISFLAAACGSGEVGGDSPQPPEVTVARVYFSPSSDEAVTQSVTLSRTIAVQKIGEVFSASLDVVYNPAVVEFVGGSQGAFLSQNGASSTEGAAVLQNGRAGTIVIGVTRLGTIGTVSGDGELVTLNFRAIGPGSTMLSFSGNSALQNDAGQDVDVVVWEPGAVTVQ